MKPSFDLHLETLVKTLSNIPRVYEKLIVNQENQINWCVNTCIYLSTLGRWCEDFVTTLFEQCKIAFRY